jgi:hypothetical protein
MTRAILVGALHSLFAVSLLPDTLEIDDVAH